MVYIRNMSGGMQLIFFIFIVVWVLDTAAYAFGRMLGKHKLAKNVSPKKTIEGAVAGIVFGVAAAVACRYIFMSEILTVLQALILGFAISIVGQFSDLAESLIKRDGNIKDSGKIIPGHGGVFDRFDSYIFAAPAVYYLLNFISKI
jgi:phosphatidate cytidylyltransferase